MIVESLSNIEIPILMPELSQINVSQINVSQINQKYMRMWERGLGTRNSVENLQQCALPICLGALPNTFSGFL